MTEDTRDPDGQPIGALAIKLFRIFQYSARASLLLVIPVTAYLYYYNITTSLEGDKLPVSRATASFAAALFTNIIPVLIVVAFIKPIADIVSNARNREADTTRTKNTAQALYEVLRPDSARTEAAIQRLELLISANIPIVKFYSSFEDVKWNDLLLGAKELHISAFYWSSDWLERNFIYINRAIEAGTVVSFIVSNPFYQDSEFYGRIRVSEKFSKRILETIGRYQSICSNKTGGGESFLFLQILSIICQLGSYTKVVLLSGFLIIEIAICQQRGVLL